MDVVVALQTEVGDRFVADGAAYAGGKLAVLRDVAPLAENACMFAGEGEARIAVVLEPNVLTAEAERDVAPLAVRRELP